IRPVRFLPLRSARSCSDKLPLSFVLSEVEIQSVELTGSLLVMPAIEHAGLASVMSETWTFTVTSTSLWFGGQRISGLAFAALIMGGVVSCTVTVTLAV